jgi:hypothetical protein
VAALDARWDELVPGRAGAPGRQRCDPYIDWLEKELEAARRNDMTGHAKRIRTLETFAPANPSVQGGSFQMLDALLLDLSDLLANKGRVALYRVRRL